jgi:hypothetical protein
MKPSGALLAAAAIVASAAAAVFAALYFANEPETKTVVEQPCGDRIFGHIDSLAKQGDHYELRSTPHGSRAA